MMETEVGVMPLLALKRERGPRAKENRWFLEAGEKARKGIIFT